MFSIRRSTRRCSVSIDEQNAIHRCGLEEEYPNIDTAQLRLFLTLLVTDATCEQSFGTLKLIKSYVRSSISQDRISELALILIEHDAASRIDYD